MSFTTVSRSRPRLVQPCAADANLVCTYVPPEWCAAAWSLVWAYVPSSFEPGFSLCAIHMDTLSIDEHVLHETAVTTLLRLALDVVQPGIVFLQTCVRPFIVFRRMCAKTMALSFYRHQSQCCWHRHPKWLHWMSSFLIYDQRSLLL
jgi:hypothetical protein